MNKLRIIIFSIILSMVLATNVIGFPCNHILSPVSSFVGKLYPLSFEMFDKIEASFKIVKLIEKKYVESITSAQELSFIARVQLAYALKFGFSDKEIIEVIQKLFQINEELSKTIASELSDLTFQNNEKVVKVEDAIELLSEYFEVENQKTEKNRTKAEKAFNEAVKIMKKNFIIKTRGNEAEELKELVNTKDFLKILGLSYDRVDNRIYGLQIKIASLETIKVEDSFESFVLDRVNSFLRKFYQKEDVKIELKDLHIGYFKKLLGHCSPVSKKIYVYNFSNLKLTKNDIGARFRNTLMHEALHQFSIGFFNIILDESLTEFFSRQDSGVGMDRSYDQYLSLAGSLVQKIGFDEVKRIYIQGDLFSLKENLGEELFEILFLENNDEIWNCYEKRINTAILNHSSQTKLEEKKLFKDIKYFKEQVIINKNKINPFKDMGKKFLRLFGSSE